ncbi:hypothetical protein WQ57_07350 [Mesobacillus campisalis]|uniref:Beta-N-acetylglucosaminidase n=1 Tax=Mesobacillus campisalis TaxID=1408103 RepID=A0A0M2T0M2_9BACI|nr:N-acetylglucosaminidase [Mesobacillus campisalis]KKK38787.1 hypothetical protein WQ57_07350 [Mesobacillus campisalis]
MKGKFIYCSRVFVLLWLLVLIFPEYNNAYTDLSTYKIETGKFVGESSANTSLVQFKKDTGWDGSYAKTNEYETYYRIRSGEFLGEARVNNVVQQFTKETGLSASYKGTGEPQNYHTIISGGFPQSKVDQVLQQFKKETGINAKAVGVGEPENYYQLVSGGFPKSKVENVLTQFRQETGIDAKSVGVGEQQNYYQLISGGFPNSKVEQVLQQFQEKTGISAKYVGVGEPQNYYLIISGGFNGLSRATQVLQQFEATTNIQARLVSLGNNKYIIESVPVLGYSNVEKGRQFFENNNWYVRTPLTGEKAYKSYQIITVPILGITQMEKGRQFFEANNWYVRTTITGEKDFSSYQIKSEPVLGYNQIQKALNFFEKNNWYARSPLTGEKGYSSYQVVSDPVLGYSMAEKGRQFFLTNNWYARIPTTGQQGYTSFRVISDPVLGWNETKKGLDFFAKNKWAASAPATGAIEYFYKISTQDFEGYDKAQAAAQRIQSLYGWNTTLVKTKNGPQLMYTDYGMTLPAMLDKQMQGSPQTDKYRNEPRFIHADYVDLTNKVVTADRVNVRTGPSTTSSVTQQVNAGTSVMVIAKTGDWVEVRLTWQNATASDVGYYLNPDNFSINNKDYFQFLKLSQTANINASEVNEKILKGKGILDGKGQAFVDAAQRYNINELYLISHSLLETGNGTSSLATGTVYNGRTVYNMYGYGAYDSCPLTCGAKAAYDNGWFTPEAAIVGGAQFISSRYIYNTTFQQDTLYKMRWNPVQPWHQYATDIGWAYKQVNSIYNLYQLLDNYTLYYDVPNYQYR